MAISKGLIEYLLFDNLRYFSTSGATVDKNTVFSSALGASKVAGSTPRSIFRDVSRHDIVINGGTDKPWPTDWLNKTPATLAPALV
ncbi:hypothetical protein LRS03_24160 [Rhizobacter sp. J219]|jgi:hypothetical protein|uniref:hypothetical protein n=1 Tax=Rhizobacter sp. J219 TaxID=2898430 RepID=UPI0021508CE8|nr:hypothetical protein [Rhizobacter sp. J219]MCR5885782.1 hypothetical protein [Rhizobacter sp. J219]